MKLKGNRIIVRPAATLDDITDNFESVHFIDSGLVMGQLTQATLKDAKDLQSFMKAHCSATHYLFQIKKCGKGSCFYWTLHPVVLPQSEFEKLNFIPLHGDHYKEYEELCGQVPSEVCRPSLQSSGSSEAKESDKENKKLLIAAKVRSVIVCLECRKPRCVYAAATHAPIERNQMKQIVSNEVYTCGSALFPPTSSLHIQLSVVKLSIAMIQWRLNTTAVYASHFLQYAGFVRPRRNC